MDIRQRNANQEYILLEDELLVSSTDLDGNINFVNDNFVRVSGFTDEELIGSSHNIVRHPDMPKEAFVDLWKNILSGKSWSGIIKNKQKNGGFYWVKSDIIVLYKQGVHTGFMSVRSKPKAGEIAEVENVYRKFKLGKPEGLFFRNGAVVKKSKKKLLSRFTLQQRVIAFSLFSVAALFLALFGEIYTSYEGKNTINHFYYGHIESLSQLIKVENIWKENKILLNSSLSVNSFAKNLAISRKLDANMTMLAVFENKINESVKEGHIKKKHQYAELLQLSQSILSTSIKRISSKLKSTDIDDQRRELKRIIFMTINKIQQFNIKIEKIIKNNKSESHAIYIESERHFIVNVITSVVFAVIFMLMLFFAVYFFNRDIQGRLEQIKKAFQRLMLQDYLFDIEIDREDEISTVFESLKTMKVRLAFNMEALKARSTSATRIKIALDKAHTSVMIADLARNIIYANPAVVKLFKNAEKELKEVIPGFDPDNFIGTSIDNFHKDPAHQANLLKNLTKEYHVEADVNGRVLKLIVTPVNDEQGVRIGTVAEWEDRTNEVAIEKEIADVIKAAARGDFSLRMKSEDKNKFFRELSKNINNFMEVNEDSFGNIGGVLSGLSKGDLTTEITNDYEGAFGELKDNANATVAKLKEMIVQIKISADTINTATKEIAIGTMDLSQRTERQACSLEVTASSMEEITTTVKQNSENAKQANQLARTTSAKALEGGAIVGKFVSNMSDINASSHEIMDIISVIDSIAFQTNILALNAAVEAARAGEQGRGFAVVASEVRNLAQRSATAAKEVKTLITSSVEKADLGTKLADEARKSINDVVDSIQDVASLIEEITTASVEQSVGIDQVSNAITQMDDVTQQNSTLVEEALGAASSLEEQVANLAISVAVFDTGDDLFVSKVCSLSDTQNKNSKVKSSIENDDDWSDF